MMRGIRGATTVSQNNSTEIYEKTSALLEALIEKNAIDRKMWPMCSSL